MAKAITAIRMVAAGLIVLLSAAILDLAGWICPEMKWAYCEGVALGVERVKQVEK